MADIAKTTNYKRQFNAANYDRIEITVKKGSKITPTRRCKGKRGKFNGYIKNAIQARYKADTGEDIEL